MFGFEFVFSSYWRILLVILLFAAIVSPLVWWRKGRWVYVSMLSLLLAVGTAALGVLDWNAQHFLWLRPLFLTPGSHHTFKELRSPTFKALELLSTHGGLHFEVRRTDAMMPNSGVTLLWVRIPRSAADPARYPLFRQPSARKAWEAAGYRLELGSLPLVAVTLPHYFVVVVLAAFSAAAFRRHRRLYVRNRIANNLCLHCGYSLQGHLTAADPDGTILCPECGATAKARDYQTHKALLLAAQTTEH